MNIVLTTFLIHILSSPVAPRTAKRFLVSGHSRKALVRRPLISTNRETGLRRKKRDIVSWNRMRNTLSKVSRTHSKPPSNSLQVQIEQHYRNFAHQLPSSHYRKNNQTGKVDVEQQFLMEFFY